MESRWKGCRVPTTPFPFERQEKSHLTFRKIILEQSHTNYFYPPNFYYYVFDRVPAHPPHPYSNKFSERFRVSDNARLLVPSALKTLSPSRDPSQKFLVTTMTAIGGLRYFTFGFLIHSQMSNF